MISYSANELRCGVKIVINGEPYTVINNEFIKPGKGQSFNRVRLRNLFSGRLLLKVFKSGDQIEIADVINIECVYLYHNSKTWYFINNKNFEQIAVDTRVVSHSAHWLTEQSECTLILWNGCTIKVNPPNFVELKVIETNPGVKGDTAANTGSKLAVLITGVRVKVPLFIQIGEIIKIDTRSGEYISRIK